MQLRTRYANDIKRYGYVEGGMDWWDTQFVIAPQFEWAEDFSEDLGCVQIGGKYGFIDATGQWVIPLQFDNARSFGGGRAVVAVAGRYGAINHNGQFLIPPQFEALGDFLWPLTRAKLDGQWGYITTTGEWAIPPQFSFAWDFDEDNTAYVAQGTRDGRITLEGEMWDGWSQAPQESMPYLLRTPLSTDFLWHE